MKNAGVGVGIPDIGRVKLAIVEDDEKLHIHSGASCIGQGLGTVLVQMVVDQYRSETSDDIVYERSKYHECTGFRNNVRLQTDTNHRRSGAGEPVNKLMEDRKTRKSME